MGGGLPTVKTRYFFAGKVQGIGDGEEGCSGLWGVGLVFAFVGAGCGGDAVEFFLEVLGEVLGVVEADGVGDLGDCELAFLEEFGGAPETDMANEFNGSFSGQQ